MIQNRITGRTAADIAVSIEGAIQRGRLESGSLLPTVRELAASLHVSPATVGAAYRVLQSRGLVLADRRRGTRVRSSERPARQPSVARDAAASATVDLMSGNPDVQLLPQLATALRDVPAEAVRYGDAAEVRELVAFAKAEFLADGIDAPDVMVTSGALDAIERILREHLRPGDRVAVEDPCFPALLDLLAVSRFEIVPIAVDAQGPRPGAVEEAFRRRPHAVILTPRAQNPTGAAITVKRGVELRSILDRHPAPVLIENDPLGPVAGVPVVTLTEGRSHWAIVRSTSKFLGPDLRVAIVTADDTTLGRVRSRQALGTRWVSRVLQHLALSLWSDPSSGRHLARTAELYAYRRGALLRALREHGLDIEASSGFNVWIPVRHEAVVVELLAARGWAVAAGERFRLRSQPAIRVTTSALEPKDAQRFAGDLAEALQLAPPALA